MYIYSLKFLRNIVLKVWPGLEAPNLKGFYHGGVIKSNTYFLILLALKMAAKVSWRMKDLFYMLKSTVPTKDF